MHFLRAVAGAFLLAAGFVAAQASGAPPVAAAADLKFALEEVAAAFARDTGRTVRLSFGSSGNFAQQIEQGAPFELFLSADENFVFRIADKGLAPDRGTLYAVGRVVLFAPHGSPLQADAALEDLAAAVTDGRLRRFAIANPQHAPYGRAAQAVLQHLGLWQDIERRLVIGENAAQAMQFAAAGSCQGGIVPLSLSRAAPIAGLGTFVLIPAEWHATEPLRQRMVLTRHAGETARAFYDYLQQPAARGILSAFGFAVPGSDPD
jgi:molybdate transport system substrate-binding protein